MKDDIRKLLMLFNQNEKKKLLILFFLMIIAAIFETIGIGLIVPFVGIVTKPSLIQEQAILKFIYELLKFQSTSSFLVFSVTVLFTIFMLKNMYLLFFNNLQLKIILNQQVQLSKRLFKEYLIKPYTFHLQRNTADLLRNVNNEVPKVFQGIIISGLQLITEFLVIICIVLLLFITAPIATITASILLGGSVFLFFRFFRKKINLLGLEQQKVYALMIRWVNQGLGAAKEIKVSARESFFINAYTAQSQVNANNYRYLKMLDQTPRLFIETLLVSIVLITMLIIVFQGIDSTQLISTMALFAMAAFRLMPSINRVVGLITAIRYNQPALSILHDDLFLNKEKEKDRKLFDNKEINMNFDENTFKHSIILENISFRYPNQKDFTLKDISLTIPIKKSVAFVGESGAGKTTIVDLILGLLEPEKGEVLVDSMNLFNIKTQWHKKIGYIPQVIYLSDDTIRSNVAFGIESELIDDKEIWRALEQAQLKEFVKSLPEQLETNVGERGVRLSGGQRQRIGIARALYHNPEILFMDEATSALDSETEKEIMKSIDGLKGNKTLIMIAHRLSTIENCDIVYRMSKGQITKIEHKVKKQQVI